MGEWIVQQLKLTIIATLLAWSSYTQAANWILLTQAEDDTKYYLDTERSELNRDQPMTWEKYILPKAEKRAYGWEKSKVIQYEYNCESKQYRILSLFVYDAKGSVLISHAEADEWQVVVPDSIGEGMLNRICANRDEMRAQ